MLDWFSASPSTASASVVLEDPKQTDVGLLSGRRRLDLSKDNGIEYFRVSKLHLCALYTLVCCLTGYCLFGGASFLYNVITPRVIKGVVTSASFMSQLPRRGQEIMACGQLFNIDTEVVLWTDPGGYDGYRVETRNTAFNASDWGNSSRHNPVLQKPNRYDLRFSPERSADYSYKELTPKQLEEVRGGGWKLEDLQNRVDWVVLHYDVAGYSRSCFRSMQDLKGLSAHFLLDLDGTIYQTLDLKERAWHASRGNSRSVGIEMANIGGYHDKKPHATHESPANQQPARGIKALQKAIEKVIDKSSSSSNDQRAAVGSSSEQQKQTGSSSSSSVQQKAGSSSSNVQADPSPQRPPSPAPPAHLADPPYWEVFPNWYRNATREERSYGGSPVRLVLLNNFSLRKAPGTWSQAPCRPAPVRGTINDRTLLQYDFTNEQYVALAKLVAALALLFPRLHLRVPLDKRGAVPTRVLSDKELEAFSGVLGHWHIADNKVDPGPAFQWDWLMTEATRLARRANTTQTRQNLNYKS
eukprot:g24530.t1